LRRAGLHRITVSLDTLRPERFLAITRRDEHARVLDGIAAARREGFTGTKIDAVIIRGVNDDELSDLIGFGRANDAEVRFIEYMDVPGATQWTMKNIVSRAEYCPGWSGATARSRRLPAIVQPRRPDSFCPTEPSSASSPRLRSRSVRAVTAAV